MSDNKHTGVTSPWNQIELRKQELLERCERANAAKHNLPQPVQTLIDEAKSRSAHATNVTRDTVSRSVTTSGTPVTPQVKKNPWSTALSAKTSNLKSSLVPKPSSVTGSKAGKIAGNQ